MYAVIYEVNFVIPDNDNDACAPIYYEGGELSGAEDVRLRHNPR